MLPTRDKSKYLEDLKEKPKCQCHQWKQKHGKNLNQKNPTECGKHGAQEAEAIGRFSGQKATLDGGSPGTISFELDLCAACAEQTAKNCRALNLPFWEL